MATTVQVQWFVWLLASVWCMTAWHPSTLCFSSTVGWILHWIHGVLSETQWPCSIFWATQWQGLLYKKGCSTAQLQGQCSLARNRRDLQYRDFADQFGAFLQKLSVRRFDDPVGVQLAQVRIWKYVVDWVLEDECTFGARFPGRCRRKAVRDTPESGSMDFDILDTWQ